MIQNPTDYSDTVAAANELDCGEKGEWSGFIQPNWFLFKNVQEKLVSLAKPKQLCKVQETFLVLIGT